MSGEPEKMAAPDKISTAENAARLANALQDGKKVLVRAPRGCGKSTLIKMVCGLANVDVVYVLSERSAEVLGDKACVYESPTFSNANSVDVAGKCLIFDEPWCMTHAWIHLLTDGPRLYIGTPDGGPADEQLATHGEMLCDVVERLGYPDEPASA